jgi:hypothetical protein
LTCDGLDFVIFTVGEQKITFIIDTGATLSILQKEKVPIESQSYESDTVISGVGGEITSNHVADVTLQHGNTISFMHRFHILQDMPCHADGIIGLDFLRTYNAIINLQTNELILHNENESCVVQIHRSSDSETCLSLPARSESMHLMKVKLFNLAKDYVVNSKQLTENVFLAGTVGKVKQGRIPVRILNTSDEDIKLPVFEPHLEDLSGYNICDFQKSSQGVGRVKKLLSSLKLNHLNDADRKLIESICAKYADVFYLDGDKLGTTNILNQSKTVNQSNLKKNS